MGQWKSDPIKCRPKIVESADLTTKIWVRVNVTQKLLPKLFGSNDLTQNFRKTQHF